MLSAFASVELEISFVAGVVMPSASAAVVEQEKPTAGIRCLAVEPSVAQLMADPQSVCWSVAAGSFSPGFADHCVLAIPAAVEGSDSCFEQIQAESL